MQAKEDFLAHWADVRRAPDSCISRVAGELARYFGPQACAEVRQRCLEALAQGDLHAVRAWLRILAAVRNQQAPPREPTDIRDRISQIGWCLSAYIFRHCFARRPKSR